MSEDEHAKVTIRAEMSRLRSVLGPIELSSRPYRLERDRHLTSCGLREASAAAICAGPSRPTVARSANLHGAAIERLRDELHMYVRSCLLGSDNADACCHSPTLHMGETTSRSGSTPCTSCRRPPPRYAQVAAHVVQLDAELSLATFSTSL